MLARALATRADTQVERSRAFVLSMRAIAVSRAIRVRPPAARVFVRAGSSTWTPACKPPLRQRLRMMKSPQIAMRRGAARMPQSTRCCPTVRIHDSETAAVGDGGCIRLTTCDAYTCNRAYGARARHQGCCGTRYGSPHCLQTKAIAEVSVPGFNTGAPNSNERCGTTMPWHFFRAVSMLSKGD